MSRSKHSGRNHDLLELLSPLPPLHTVTLGLHVVRELPVSNTVEGRDCVSRAGLAQSVVEKFNLFVNVRIILH